MLQKDQNIDYVVDFEAFLAKVTMGSFSTLNVSFGNARHFGVIHTEMLNRSLAD